MTNFILCGLEGEDMEIDYELIKKIRAITGVGIMDCKNALKETGDDIDKAVELLRKKGKAKAEKKMLREAQEGLIGTYIHFDGKLGTIVEVNCETDFVARNEEFRNFVKEVAIQVAATHPQYINKESVPENILEREKDIIREQLKDTGKPENVIDKIIDGKLNKFYEENCLMEHEYYKDENRKFKDVLQDNIVKFGENIKISRFEIFQVGEE
jgi:elongation factor Ts